MSVLSAKLIVKPNKDTYKNISELPTISAFWIDPENRLTEVLTDVTGQYSITSELFADLEYRENNYYSFDILNFILYKMDAGIYSDESLYFTLSAEENATTFKRVLLEDQSFESSLKIQLYYVVY